VLLAAAFYVAGMAPAQAQGPNSESCFRLDAVANNIVAGRHVPDDVLEMAKRHCNDGNKYVKQVEWDHYGTGPAPTYSVKDPCRAANSGPRRLHEAECVVWWLSAWQTYGDGPQPCFDWLQSKADGESKADQDQQLSSCEKFKQDEHRHNLIIAGIVIGVIAILIVSAIVGALSGMGGGSGGYTSGSGEHPLAYRARQQQELSNYLRKF
jgi:hypothetical protein